MSSIDKNQTRYTLIVRALDLNDEAAWQELYDHYMTFIYYILNKSNIPSADLDDLCQEVFLKLSQKLPLYERSKGSFRSWLGAFVKHAALNYYRSANIRKKYHDKLSREPVSLVENSPIDKLIEEEWLDYLKTIAIRRVTQRFSGKANDVFRLDLEEKNAEEISEITGLAINSVYALRLRIKKALQSEYEAIKVNLER